MLNMLPLLCAAAVAEGPYADNTFFPVPHPGGPGLPVNLTVAVGQTSATGHGNLDGNTDQVIKMIRDGAVQGARVVLFPEEGVTGYYKDYIQNLTQQQLTAAEARIAAACKASNVYAIVGIPHFANTTHWHNTALVIDPRGEKIYRQAKMYRCCEPDGVAGKWLGTFEIDNVTCSVMICFDEFFPEVARLPALAGSRVMFYLSWEAGIQDEYRNKPARAQVVARAQENMIYVVHANAGAGPGGSHVRHGT